MSTAYSGEDARRPVAPTHRGRLAADGTSGPVARIGVGPGEIADVHLGRAVPGGERIGGRRGVAVLPEAAR